jgi:hypothetical protein
LKVAESERSLDKEKIAKLAAPESSKPGATP